MPELTKERDTSFTTYRSEVSRLKLKELTKVLSPSWIQVLDSLNLTMWNQYKIDNAKAIAVRLVKSLNRGDHDVWTFRERFRWLAHNIEQIVVDQISGLVIPSEWSSLHAIDTLIQVIQDIRMYDIEQLEAGKIALTAQQFSEKTTHLARLTQSLEEQKAKKLYLGYRGYLLSLTGLIANEEVVVLARENENIFHYLWSQPWSVFLQAKQDLLTRFPPKLRSPTTNVLIEYNPLLLELLLSINERMWYCTKEEAFDIRYRIIYGMQNLRLPLWPQTMGEREPRALTAAFTGHCNLTLSNLTMALKRLETLAEETANPSPFVPNRRSR